MTLLLAVGLLGVGLAGTASADVVDAAGDFLSTYTGPQGGDLDVIRSDVTYDGTTFVFTARLNAAIGTTTGAFYVWGINRGQGTARLAAGTPSLGSDILFDAVVIGRPDGTGQVNDLTTTPPTTTTLATSLIQIVGDTIRVSVAAALLPSRGLAQNLFTWNLWPRLAGTNAAISDFAPNAGNAPVTAVPEPASLALLAVGGLAAARLARGRRRPAR